MIALLLYFFLLLILFFKCTKKLSIARLVLGCYLLSCSFSVVGVFVDYNEMKLDNIAIMYYSFCVLISLCPIIFYANTDCRYFTFNERFIKYFSIVLIVLSFIKIYYSITQFSMLAVAATQLSDIRSNYYQGNADVLVSTNKIEVMANLIVHISYLSPYFGVYYLIKNKFFVAFLLLLSSMCMPIDGLCIGEREASLKWLFNCLCAVLFFLPVTSKRLKAILKTGSLVLLGPVVLFIIAMTISRFGGDDDTDILKSLYIYVGAMPENFSYFFNEVNPMIGGNLNFNFFIPGQVPFEGQYNDFISADRYLNVFAGMPGTLWLDFDYFTIFYVIFITILMLMLMKKNKGNSRHSFLQFYFFVVQLQVSFMNIFYYDFVSKYLLSWFFIISFILLLFLLFDKKKVVIVQNSE